MNYPPLPTCNYGWDTLVYEVSMELAAEKLNVVPPPSYEQPIRVREAAAYLGVSAQTVYLWVERKQIPHFRVMGRNIRFLKSELEPFRAQFKQEVVNWQDQ